jgi:nucleoid DNA-binding protein
MVRVSLDHGRDVHVIEFGEHEHADRAARRDNNMRAAIIHVIADAAAIPRNRTSATSVMSYRYR